MQTQLVDCFNVLLPGKSGIDPDLFFGYFDTGNGTIHNFFKNGTMIPMEGPDFELVLIQLQDEFRNKEVQIRELKAIRISRIHLIGFVLEVIGKMAKHPFLATQGKVS